MISLLRILPAFLFATCLFEKALSTPIRSKNVDLRTESLRPSIQPRQQDWGKVATEIRDDTALIDLLNDIGICDEPPQLLGVNTFANAMLKKGYTSQAPFVFYTSGMGHLAEEWAPKFFQDPNRKAPLHEWKYAIWDRISSKSPFSLFEKMIRLKSAVETQLRDSDYRSIVSFWTSDITQKNEVQAIAETIKGDAYLVISSEQNPSNDVNGWDPDTAWGGWEFPALTRANRVTTVYRIDPTKDSEPVVIWKAGDPTPDQMPKGNKDDITFAGGFGDYFKMASKEIFPLERDLAIMQKYQDEYEQEDED